MASLGNAYVNIIADAKKLKPGLDKARATVASSVDKMADKIRTLTFQAAIVGAAAFSAAVVYNMKKAVDAASDLEEVTAKFGTVYKDQIGVAEKNAQALVDSYGLSTRASKEYLGAMQDLLVPMGMASGAAAKMSNEVVKLSVDLGSFNNVATADVMRDIQSALVGNFETMKKYGVVLNQNVVAQEALSSGLVASKDQLDANTKAQAAYQLIVKGSTFAIGDWARTSDGFANQMKQLTSNMENLRAELGNHFLPVITPIVQKINDWIMANKEFIKTKIADTIKGIVVWVDRLKIGIGFLYDAFSTLWKLVSTIPKGVIKFFDDVAKNTKIATEEIKKFNDEVGKIEPPPMTPWQELVRLFGRWGEEIVEVFVFMENAFASVLGFMGSTFVSFVKVIAGELYSLNEVIGKLMVFDFSGAKKSLDKMGTTLDVWLGELKTNWDVYDKGISDSWNTMISNMENRLFGAALVPKLPELPDIPLAEDEFAPVVLGGGGGDNTEADAERLALLNEQFYAAQQERLGLLAEIQEQEMAMWIEQNNLQIEMEKELQGLSVMQAAEAAEEKLNNYIAYSNAEIAAEKNKINSIANLEKSAAKSRMTTAIGLGTALLNFAGTNSEAIFAITKGLEVGQAIMAAYAASNLALANPPGPPTTIPLAAAVLKSGLWNAAAIGAVALGQFAASSGGGGSVGGGTYTSPTITTPGVTDYNTMPEEERRGTLTINIQGDILNEEYIDLIVEKINEAEDRDVFINQANYARVAA